MSGDPIAVFNLSAEYRNSCAYRMPRALFADLYHLLPQSSDNRVNPPYMICSVRSLPHGLIEPDILGHKYSRNANIISLPPHYAHEP